MKKYLLLVLATVLYTTATAQTKGFAVYDLIKAFAPEAASPGLSGDWKTSTSPAAIKWTNTSPKKILIGYIRSGSVTAIAPAQKPVTCSIDLSGPTLNGYTEINLSLKPPAGKDGDYAYDAAALFGSMASQAKLLKKDDGGFPMYNYQLNIPGKKTLWLIIMLDTGGAHADEDAATVNIICLTDKKEFDKRTAY